LTGDADSQERDFHDIVPLGERLLAFGAVHHKGKNPMSPAEVMVQESANNYRRWWNNPWNVVERGGQRKAGPWTTQDEVRHWQRRDVRWLPVSIAHEPEPLRSGVISVKLPKFSSPGSGPNNGGEQVYAASNRFHLLVFAVAEP